MACEGKCEGTATKPFRMYPHEHRIPGLMDLIKNVEGLAREDATKKCRKQGGQNCFCKGEAKIVFLIGEGGELYIRADFRGNCHERQG